MAPKVRCGVGCLSIAAVLRSGIGNHRGSVFRLLLGIALAKQNNIPLPESWGVAGSSGEAARRLYVDRIAVNEAEAGI